MGVLILALVAVFAVSNSDHFSAAAMDEPAQVQYSDTDEGDIAQIFAQPERTEEKNLVVIVERPASEDCFGSRQGDVMVRDLTVPYQQRRYIRSDGSFCTPIQ